MHSLLPILLTALLISSVASVRAQELKIDSAEITNDGTIHQFSYYRNPETGDTIVHGRYIETAISTTGSSIFDGTYLHGIHQGRWLYRAINENPSGNEKPYRVEVVGEFRAKVPHGEWSVKVWDRGGKQELRSSVTVNFAHGVYLGRVACSASETATARNVTVEGFVSPADYMDSTWIFRYTNDEGTFEERRLYRHGYLVSLDIRDVEKNRSVQHGRNDDVALWVDSLERTADRFSLSHVAGPEEVVLFLQSHRYNTIEGLDGGNEVLNYCLNLFCRHSTRLAPGCHPLYLRNLSPNRSAAQLRGLDSALTITPGDGSLHFQRGELFFRIERYDSARAALTRAIDLKRAVDSATFLRGRANAALKNYSEAVADFRRSRERGYNTLSCNEALADVHLKAGEYKASMEVSQQVVIERPKVTWPKYRIALCHLGLGNVDLARKVYRHACADQGGDTKAYRNAMRDLKDLADRGVQPEAARAILRDYFGLSESEIREIK